MSVRKDDAFVARWERASENWLLGHSLIFLVVLIFPLAHPLSPMWKMNLERADITIWVVFGMDYLFKLAMAENKQNFIKGHFFELLIVAISFFRPLRLLRLIPLIGYFLRYSKRSLSGRLLQYVSLAAILVTAPSAVLMFQIERNAPNANIKTLWDGIWWGAATVTTVGYGDKYPTTNLGRFLAILVMIVGVSLVGVITATVASWFVKADVDDPKEIQFKRVLDRLESIEQKLNDLTGTEESAKVET